MESQYQSESVLIDLLKYTIDNLINQIGVVSPFVSQSIHDKERIPIHILYDRLDLPNLPDYVQ